MIELEGVPELIDPVMVAAFEGWNDAGDAASAAVAHLDREWKGEVFAALDAEDYYDFQVNRPTVFLDGGVRKITWPTTRLSVVRVGDKNGKGARATSSCPRHRAQHALALVLQRNPRLRP